MATIKASAGGYLSAGGTTATCTIPSGLAVGDPLDLFIADAGTNTSLVTTPPTGWTVVAQAVMNNGYWAHLQRTGGWQTADGTSVTVTFARSALVTYGTVALDGTKYSGWGSNGTVTTRSTSQTTNTAAASGSTGQDILVVSVEKSSTHTADPTVSGGAAQAASYWNAAASSASVWVGIYTASSGTAAQTITYGAASGNGAAYQIPLTAVASSAASGAGSVTFTGAAAATGVGAAAGNGTATFTGSATGGGVATASGAATFTGAAASSGTTPTAFPQSGGITPTGATVIYATTGVSSARVAYSTSSSMTSPSYSGTITPDSDGIVAATLTGLTADTPYWYELEANGTLLSSSQGRFRTFPTAGSAASFSMLFGSCQYTNSNHAVFSTIAAHSTPHTCYWFGHLGDLHYADWQTNGITSASTIKSQQKSSTQQSNVAALLARYPWVYLWDNHDWGGANSDGTNPAASVLEAMYRQMVPHYTLPTDTSDNTGAIDQTFTIGRVSVFVMDSRSQRSPSANTDNSSKTMLGAGQKSRLKAWMSSTSAPVKLLMTGIMFKTASGTDRWGSYTTEYSELSTYWAASGFGQLVVVAGDIHNNAADDGTNDASFHAPLLIASAFDQAGTTSGGSFTGGQYPSSGTNTTHNFGVLDITDTGSAITIALTGYDSTDTSNVTASKTITTAASTTAAGAVSFTGAAAGTGAATAAGAVSFTGAATVAPTATAAGSATFTGASSSTTASIASGTATFTGAAITGPLSAAAGTFTATGAGGTQPQNGTAAGNASFVGAANAQTSAAAVGGVTFTGAANIVLGNTAAGVFAATGSASATAQPATASAAGNVAFTGAATATGAAAAVGGASFTGAAGIAGGPGAITAAGTVTFTATATSAAPLTASGTVVFVGGSSARGAASAAGQVTFTATASATSGTATITGTAVFTAVGGAAASVRGSAAGTVTFTATASSSNIPVRDITITAALSPERFTAQLAAERFTATLEVDDDMRIRSSEGEHKYVTVTVTEVNGETLTGVPMQVGFRPVGGVATYYTPTAEGTPAAPNQRVLKLHVGAGQTVNPAKGAYQGDAQITDNPELVLATTADWFEIA